MISIFLYVCIEHWNVNKIKSIETLINVINIKCKVHLFITLYCTALTGWLHFIDADGFASRHCIIYSLGLYGFQLLLCQKYGRLFHDVFSNTIKIDRLKFPWLRALNAHNWNTMTSQSMWVDDGNCCGLCIIKEIKFLDSYRESDIISSLYFSCFWYFQLQLNLQFI